MNIRGIFVIQLSYIKIMDFYKSKYMYGIETIVSKKLYFKETFGQKHQLFVW